MSMINIPASVRYDLALPPMAVVIYGEVARLCRESGGETLVKNEELAALYCRDVQTISGYIKLLVERGHLCSEPQGVRRVLRVAG